MHTDLFARSQQVLVPEHLPQLRCFVLYSFVDQFINIDVENIVIVCDVFEQVGDTLFDNRVGLLEFAVDDVDSF